MKINDTLQLKGEVVIKAVDASGNTSILLEDKNLIVSNGRKNLCNFLANTIGSSYIFDVVFGTGGTIAGNPNAALSVDPSQVTVNKAIVAVKGTDYFFAGNSEPFPSPRAVFSIILPETPTLLNGQAISEMALMLNTSPSSAFAIKNFPSISKSSAISLVITWTIYV